MIPSSPSPRVMGAFAVAASRRAARRTTTGGRLGHVGGPQRSQPSADSVWAVPAGAQQRSRRRAAGCGG
ncbi:hypothetical protein ACFPM0_28960 [Pseudonocardia sulfidoxydans]|uniref:hypothetical protein n=1 Tax=Pseudonocardia sulfidoxydans TaxID=54011 RepID=UPI00361FC1E5